MNQNPLRVVGDSGLKPESGLCDLIMMTGPQLSIVTLHPRLLMGIHNVLLSVEGNNGLTSLLEEVAVLSAAYC